MNDEDYSHHNLKRTKKVIEPLSGQAVGEQNAAVEMIRNKINALYQDEPNAKEEIAEVKATANHRSKHQQFMYELSQSGKSLADIQASWHQYYVDLPDNEKHQVWQEFYAEHAKVDNAIKQARVHPPQQSAKPAVTSSIKKKPSKSDEPADLRTLSEIKEQILAKTKVRSKPKNPHLQSLIFGLSMGVVVVAILLFGFFNERIIAPFITPSRVVSTTSIITDPNSTVAGKDPIIIIPKINVEIPVVYDEESVQEAAVQKALERGVLHYATTPNPGEKGNAVIFGHSSNNILNSGKYKFAFVLLSRLEKDDTFMLEKDGTRYVYKVFEKKIIPPTDLSVLGNHSGKSTVTLITCDPPGTSINRLVVVGEQISPSPANNVASSVKQETAKQSTTALPSNSPSLWSRIFGG
ncbi:sortase [Candidatus Saccharibacteria bacterium]|nr:sortase [Candidatus Saccharibacteria bacterium]